MVTNADFTAERDVSQNDVWIETLICRIKESIDVGIENVFQNLQIIESNNY
jgi:hypothetical protein